MTPLPVAVRSAVTSYRAALEAAFPHRVRRVVVFGSVARGEAHEESDVDVHVVLDGASPEDRGHAIDLASRAALAHRLVISPVVQTPAEWDDLGRRELLFHDEVERDGVPV